MRLVSVLPSLPAPPAPAIAPGGIIGMLLSIGAMRLIGKLITTSAVGVVDTVVEGSDNSGSADTGDNDANEGEQHAESEPSEK